MIEYLSEQTKALFPHHHAFDVIDSTNAWLLEKKISGAICIAKKQTHGKGTKGRQWHSTRSNNLSFSFSLRHQYEDKNVPPLSLLAGLACCEALETLGMRGQGIKWPNDIYCNNKKLAGILVEASDRLSYWVVGIGMNVETVPSSTLAQPATYVNAYLDIPVSAEQLASAILNSFTALYVDSSNWLEKWQKWDILQGQVIFILNGKQQTKGTVCGLTSGGELIVDVEGEIRAVSAGEVSIRGFVQKNV